MGFKRITITKETGGAIVRRTEEVMEFAHQAERKAFSVAIDGALKHVKKDREKSFLQLIDLAEKFMDGDKLQKEDYDKARELVKNSDGKWMKYADRILNEVDPHVV